MIIPDLNLLLYAYDAASPFHTAAARWWRDSLSGPEAVGLPPVVLFGFVRVGTSPRAFHHPLTVAEAIAHVRSWLDRPNAQLLEPRASHLDTALRLLESTGAGGNLVTDAQIAAFALEEGAVLHTADTDFLRFPGLSTFNPLRERRRPRRSPRSTR